VEREMGEGEGWRRGERVECVRECVHRERDRNMTCTTEQNRE
jgi:hypothetical protein